MCALCTWGWKSGGEGRRNLSFRAPTGSSSFLFSTLLDQYQGRGLRTKVKLHLECPTSYSSMHLQKHLDVGCGSVWSNPGWNTCIWGPWRMLRAWHSAVVVAGVAVPGAAGAGWWLIGAKTVNEGVENQMEFHPWLRPLFHLHRCGSFDYGAQLAHHYDSLGSGCQCWGPMAVLHC